MFYSPCAHLKEDTNPLESFTYMCIPRLLTLKKGKYFSLKQANNNIFNAKQAKLTDAREKIF